MRVRGEMHKGKGKEMSSTGLSSDCQIEAEYIGIGSGEEEEEEHAIYVPTKWTTRRGVNTAYEYLLR
ncbi:hypothetical protein C7212DRAFT_306119 [Tuber magnatum]|uniref:Uncharacterized protein n=1 Tax=Tuber magnatum TaxID=42249 RepID=A0A317T0F7_9PEZI|nr:hypothetical protein C7212DRAFT_306119 [Tuber magnatum]